MREFYDYFNEKIKQKVIKNRVHNILEIRLRVDRPLIIITENEEIIIYETIVSGQDIKDTFNIATNYSAYAYEDNIKEGFLSLPGGHRIGFGGSMVKKDGEKCILKDINFINFRVCNYIEGCGKEVVIKQNLIKKFENTIIISPPGLGKTTLLRDLIKNISNNLKMVNICVIDERNEIAGCYRGVPSIDLGYRTDVISNCSKDEGILMAIRSMAPEIIAVDEIGQVNDIEALKYAHNSGVKIICTVHGDCLEDVRGKLGENLYCLFKNKIIIKDIGEYICC